MCHLLLRGIVPCICSIRLARLEVAVEQREISYHSRVVLLSGGGHNLVTVPLVESYATGTVVACVSLPITVDVIEKCGSVGECVVAIDREHITVVRRSFGDASR